MKPTLPLHVVPWPKKNMPTDPDTNAIPGRAHIVTDSPLPTPTHGVPNHHTLSFSILCGRVIPAAPADCLDVILDAKACMFGPSSNHKGQA